MSNSPIIDLDQDYVLLNTNVTVGKSYSSRGWALSRQDIHDWIPVEKFERDCKVIIDDICSDAILRFNPRLFYESDELSLYLKELYDNGWYRDKIPMAIKINKSSLFSNIESVEKYLNLNFIETKLLVGKSYSSKGWQLSKEVVSKLFPSEKYAEEYSIYIDNIESNAKLNLQFRLFYKDDELSEYLEKLHKINPRDKIPAKILFEVNSNDLKEEINENEDNVIYDSNCCDICGKEYDSTLDSLDEEGKFPNLCQECIEKIVILNVYKDIKKSSLSNFVKKEFVEANIGSNFDKIWDLLIEYNFLTPLGDLFKLSGNELIENSYSKFLADDDSSTKISSKKRNRDKILELIDEEENSQEEKTEEHVCIVCGIRLNDFGLEKCELCNDKSLATEYLKEFVTKVPYGKNFSKLDLVNVGVDSLNAELFLNKLAKYDLIHFESDIFYKLNEVAFLNDFVEKYSDNPYKLQINYINENSNVLKISKEDLASEERIDAIVKWKNYGDFISFKKGQYGFLSVQFKQEGRFMYSKGFSTSYEAKIAAIYYLNSLGKIEFIVEDDIKLEFK